MSLQADAFVSKWLATEPALGILEAFLPAPRYRAEIAWFALQCEIDEAVFELSDPAVARTKLAWWGEDLAAGVAARHPLARQLLPQAAAVEPSLWRQLALTAIDLAADDLVAADEAALNTQWRPLTEALAALEAALFAAPVAAASIAASWRLRRLRRALAGGQFERSALPMNLRARWPQLPQWIEAGSAQAWAEISAAWLPELSRPTATASRRLRNRIDRQRLLRLSRGQRLQAVERPPAATALWHAWRAARGD